MQTNDRLTIPEDRMCQKCHKHPLMYRWKFEMHVCENCWTRLDDARYADYTDEQFAELRAETMWKLREAKNRGLVNLTGIS